MDWLGSIKKTIEVIEANLLEEDVLSKVEEAVFVSPLYLQKGFKTLTGFSPAEYVRNRRLYNSALDILNGNEKIIDIALRYGCETPESFTKAFSRFHGVTPMQLRKERGKPNIFLPINIQVEICGGDKMDYSIEKMDGFKVIGYSRRFGFEDSYEMIPKFWDEVFAMPFSSDVKRVVEKNCLGCLGVCIDDGAKDFEYMVAGFYKGEEVLEGMKVFEVPPLTWAKFKCKGPIPGALQSVNTEIFKKWLPGNPDWELSEGFNIEYYSDKGMPSDSDYESEIWIPVKPVKH